VTEPTKKRTARGGKKRGLGSPLMASRRTEIAKLGAAACHAQGVAHKWTHEEAVMAGRKGGLAKKSPRKPRQTGGVVSARYDVVVGNIGTVYSGTDAAEAQRTFATYVQQSLSDSGRAGGEDVTLLRGDEVAQEHVGSLSRQRED
jgi:hypothetical protein